MDSRVVFVGAEVIFICLLSTLFFLHRQANKGQSFTKMDLLYILFIFTCFLDAWWILIDGKPEFRIIHIILETIYLSITAMTGYIWFLHTLDFFPSRPEALRKYRWLLGVPVLIAILLTISSFKTGLAFRVDELGTYQRGPLLTYNYILNYLYMLLGSITALRCMKSSFLTTDKRKYFTAAFFPVPIIVLTGLQYVLPPGLPAMQGGVTIAFLLVYATSQDTLITKDYLTGLPNRSSFERNLMDKIEDYVPGIGRHLYLIEGDIDGFKDINDTFGHPFGDSVLRFTANTLSQVFAKYDAAVFRTGGDEFMIISDTEKALDIDSIGEELNSSLSRIGSVSDATLTMSLGLVEHNKDYDFRTLIEAADKELYKVKHRK